MQLLGYRLDVKGNQMLLAVHRNQYYVRIDGEDIPVQMTFEMVKDGTYNVPVRDVPYFVLDNHVYSLKSFESLRKRGGTRFE